MRKVSNGLFFPGIFLAAMATAESIEIIPPEFHGAKQPQIAATSDGQIAVAFGKENSVYLVRSEDGAKTFVSPQLVGQVGKLALGMRRGPRIAAVEKEFVISAISHSDGNLYSWIPSGTDSRWTKIQINEIPRSAREGLHAMASDGRQRVFCAWLDLRNDGTELWGASSSDGAKTWSKNFRIYQSPDGHICECCHPSVIFTAAGEVIAMWRNWLGGSRDMFWAASSDGKNFGAAKKLGPGSWPLNACPMDGGSLASGPDGKTLSVWRRFGKIFLANSDQSEELIDAKGSQPVVAGGKDKIYFAWQQGKRLMIKIQPGDTPPRALSENGVYPAMLPGSSRRGAIVVWEDPDAKSIFAEVLN